MCTRSIATRTLLALAAAAAMTTVQAQDNAEAVPPAPPVVIDADNSFYDLRAGVTRFEDNVSITRGPMEVEADQGVLRQVDGQISEVELDGSPIRWRDQLSDGSIVTGESRAMHYDVIANVVTLTGGAVIRHQQGEFTGDELVYDLDAESLAGRSTGNDRVRVVIEPEAMSGASADSNSASDDAPNEPAERTESETPNAPNEAAVDPAASAEAADEVGTDTMSGETIAPAADAADATAEDEIDPVGDADDTADEAEPDPPVEDDPAADSDGD